MISVLSSRVISRYKQLGGNIFFMVDYRFVPRDVVLKTGPNPGSQIMKLSVVFTSLVNFEVVFEEESLCVAGGFHGRVVSNLNHIDLWDQSGSEIGGQA